MNDNTGEILT